MANTSIPESTHVPSDWDTADKLAQRLALITGLATLADEMQSSGGRIGNRVEVVDEEQSDAVTDFVARHLVTESRKALADACRLVKRLQVGQAVA